MRNTLVNENKAELLLKLVEFKLQIRKGLALDPCIFASEQYKHNTFNVLQYIAV